MTAKEIRQEMIDLQLKLNATRQKFIASLPEGTKAQVANAVKAIKSDKLTVGDTGLNTGFKITNKMFVNRKFAGYTECTDPQLCTGLSFVEK